MAKVTSKRQLTVPKFIADQYGIKPGDQLDWVPAGMPSGWFPSVPGALEFISGAWKSA